MKDDRAVTPILSLRNAVKTFGPVVALADGSIDLFPGEIHALAGENGAGKSTLVKILAGLYQRDSGDFELQGEPVAFSSVASSKAAGVSVIYTKNPPSSPTSPWPKTSSSADSRAGGSA